jgi:gamma-glutamylcyclotransferase (GGCT)/AIG2-like uncharacterized protein YtfP
MAREREEVNNLFAYGTLMIEEIFRRFSNAPIQKTAGFLNGYECRQLKNRKYPGLIKGKGTVNGIVYQQLSEIDLNNLDQYEGDEYKRELVLVNIDATKKINAWCYFYKEEYRENILNEEWSLDWYHQNKQ